MPWHVSAWFLGARQWKLCPWFLRNSKDKNEVARAWKKVEWNTTVMKVRYCKRLLHLYFISRITALNFRLWCDYFPISELSTSNATNGALKSLFRIFTQFVKFLQKPNGENLPSGNNFWFVHLVHLLKYKTKIFSTGN